MQGYFIFQTLYDIFTVVIDIFLVALIIYFILKVLSKSEKLLMIFNAFLILIGLFFLSYIFNLETVNVILNNFSSWIVVIIVVLFQQEIRDSLQKLGSLNSFFSEEGKKGDQKFAGELYDACFEMSKNKTGALITLEGNSSLITYTSKAVNIDAIFSPALIQLIFEKESILHDGAVVINNGRIKYASTFYPISLDLNIDKKLGTRHRAALTISKESDSITVIVSEETAKISIAYNGKLYLDLNKKFFEEFINEKNI